MRLSNRSIHISAFPLLINLFIGLILLVVPIAAAHAASATLKYPVGSSSPSLRTGASNCGSWSVVSSPNIGPHGTGLNSVSATTASDVWAVGSYTPNNMSNKTVIEHWNGTQWSIVPGAATGSSFSYLYGVAALSTQNVWAVGNYLPSTSQTLVEHWNGTKWSIVPSPNVPSVDNYLTSITAISASNIWAVGFSSNSSNLDQTLIEHWNGNTWSIVSSPNAGSASNILNGVAADSANDVWAVGGSYTTATSNVLQTLIEHWNGSTWSIVSSPNVGSLGSSFESVTAISASNAWAVGSYTVAGSPYNYVQTLTEYWNGSTWSVVSSPNVGSNWNILEAVTHVSATNVWAVGYYTNSKSDNQTLTEHWNGTAWRVVTSPNGGVDNFLQAVTRIPGTAHIWTVGSYFPTLYTVRQTLTEFYC